MIVNSSRRQELDTIVNEAIQASHEFERIASTVEGAGYELLICLDLSAYAQIRDRTVTDRNTTDNQPTGRPIPLSLQRPPVLQFSDRDLRFLRALRITTE